MLLYPWPHHSLCQLIKHGRLHPDYWGIAEERLCVFYSELLHQSGIICPYSLLLSSASHGWVWYLLGLFFLFLFRAPLHLFQADLAGEQQSWAKQLMKMLNLTAFYTLSGNIPTIFSIHLGHSCYILSIPHTTYLDYLAKSSVLARCSAQRHETVWEDADVVLIQLHQCVL